MTEPVISSNASLNREEKKPLSAWKYAGISLATVLTGLLALVSMILPIAVIGAWSSSTLWVSVPLLVLTVSITGGLFWLAVHLNSLLKKPDARANPVCQCCAMDVPTIKVGLNRHIGAIVFMFHKSLNGHLCKPCIKKLFWEYTPITFFFGWWGIISVIITPVVLINNIIVYLRSLSMETTSPAQSQSILPEAMPSTRVL
jgi:hypothetical protein